MKLIPAPTPESERRRKVDGASSSWWSRVERNTVFIAVYAGLFLLYTLSGATPQQKHDMSDIVSPITSIGALIWSLWNLPEKFRACRRGEFKWSREGWSSTFFSIGVGCYAFGCTSWSYIEIVLRETPFPSWADAGYLSSFLFLIGGILMLPVRKMPNLARLRVMIDSLVVTTALVTFSWFFILGPTILGGDGTLFAKVLGTLYPVLDLVMLGCVMMLTMSSRERTFVRVRNLLAIGVACYAASDVVFNYLTLQDRYSAGNPCDVGWLISNLVVARAALILRKHQGRIITEDDAVAEAPTAPTFGRMVLPYAFVPAVVALLCYIGREHVTGPLALGVYISSGTLLALILVRQVLAIAENSHLYKFLQEAYRELEALATTDAMTGLPNHRLFQERLRSEIKTCRAAELPVTVLLMDVDRFKSYNDNFGHPAGDEALRIVGRILKDSVRNNDLPARYGGEEFAAILPGTDGSQAFVVAERIRAACEAETFPFRQVTLSIGIATTYEGQATELIERADKALYAAKRGGRNRIETEAQTPSLVLEVVGAGYPKGWSLKTSCGHGIDRFSEKSDEPTPSPAAHLLKAVFAMLNVPESSDRRTDRIMRFCLRLAEQAAARGALSISPAEMNDLHLGAILHDLGKSGRSNSPKPHSLTNEEWEALGQTPIPGSELLEDLPVLAGAAHILRSHHERWDGTGYPDGLAGASIPLGARLYALAEALDAMWSDRPYRAALDYSVIREEIRRMAGVKFDPALVEAFLSVPCAEWERLRNETGGDDPSLPVAA